MYLIDPSWHLKELRKDKERLEWIMKVDKWTREDIDAAMELETLKP